MHERKGQNLVEGMQIVLGLEMDKEMVDFNPILRDGICCIRGLGTRSEIWMGVKSI